MLVEVNGHVFDTDSLTIKVLRKTIEIEHGADDRWLRMLSYDNDVSPSDGIESKLDLLQ